jgi:hypothetical protein
MAYISGKTGYMTIGSCTVAALTDCDVTFGSPNEEFFTVAGNGFSSTVSTAQRGNGTINAVLDDAALISSLAASGDLVTIAIFADTGGPSMTGSARLGQFQGGFAREGTVQKLSIPFMTDGEWTGTLVT